MSKVLRRGLLPLLATLVLLALGSCVDQAPGEISMNLTLNGQTLSATVMVFNEAGKQIQEEAGDSYGVVYVKDLPPGKYTLKFKGHDNSMYPAVREVEVTAGGSATLGTVELSQASGATT